MMMVHVNRVLYENVLCQVMKTHHQLQFKTHKNIPLIECKQKKPPRALSSNNTKQGEEKKAVFIISFDVYKRSWERESEERAHDELMH